MLKKTIVSVLLFCFTFAVIAPNFALAQSPAPSPPPNQLQEVGPWYDQGYFQWYNRVYDQTNPTEIFGERYTAGQVQWIIYGLVAFFQRRLLPAGVANCLNRVDFGPCIDEVFGNPQQGSYLINPNQYQNKSLLALIFEEKPISAVSYVKDTLKKLKVSVPEAQAQETGFGFRGLGVIQEMWRSVRNVSYALFALVIVITAFMIMFRVKISPQTVITIQSAIPRIALALILITFSYPIAGLMVDLMYVVIGIIALFFQTADLMGGTASYYFGVMVNGPFDLGLLGFTVLYIIWFIIVYLGILVGGFLFTATLGEMIAGIVTGLIMAIGIIIVFPLLIIVLLWQTLKIAWLLLKTFAIVLLQTIIAPLQIAIGVVYPGVGFGAWAKSYIANLAVFPVVGLMYILAFWFLTLSIHQIQSTHGVLGGIGNLICNAVTGGWGDCYGEDRFFRGWPPLMGVTPAIFALTLLFASLVVITMISKAADMIKSFISGRPMTFGTGIGEAAGPIYGLARTASAYETGRKFEKAPTEIPVIGGLVSRIPQQYRESVARTLFGYRP